MSSDLEKTPLHDWHAAHGGRMVDFAGWSMPVQYASIVAEHQATRTAASLFDVSHMGRIYFSGPDAGRFLDHLLTRRVADLPQGKIRYSLMTNDEGGILDDMLVYHWDHDLFQLVVNASNRVKILNWLVKHREGYQVQIDDRTHQTAMIAVQGPLAVELLTPLVEAALPSMKYYSAQAAKIAGRPGYISRTGYTGEDGFELVVEAADAVAVWTTVIDAGAPRGVLPAGLASRDTLRLEAAMPLYGHELSEAVNPIQAGLGFAVNLEDRDFVGRDAIVRFAEDAEQPKRIGLELAGRRVPREGYPIEADEKIIGAVTSGTFSPTLGRPIAMGYVQPEHAAVGTSLAVDIRGRREPARVVALPFYQRSS